jgi:hypothetical protein
MDTKQLKHIQYNIKVCDYIIKHAQSSKEQLIAWFLKKRLNNKIKDKINGK